MKAFVIKNKEGKMLCWHHIAGYYFDHFNIKSLFYMQFGTEKEIKAVFKNKEFDNTDCRIVPITIYEGDPLKLACEELKCRDENKTHAKLVIQQIKNKWLGENVDYKDWFIQQAKEGEKDA